MPHQKCIVCRKQRGKPLEQIMGQTPSLGVGTGLPPRTVPYQVESEDGERGTDRYIHLYDDHGNPSRIGHRQKHRYVSNGITTFCLFTRTTEYLLVRLRNKFCRSPELPPRDNARQGHRKNPNCPLQRICVRLQVEVEYSTRQLSKWGS